MLGEGKKILVVRVSAIGDVVHTMPAVALLHKSLPGAQISWVVQEKAAALLVDQMLLQRVWVLPNSFLSPKLFFSRTLPLLKQMRQTRWDAIIEFQGGEKSAILASMLRGKVFRFDAAHVRSSLAPLVPGVGVAPVYRHIVQKNLALASVVVDHLAAGQVRSCPDIQALTDWYQPQMSLHKKDAVDAWCAVNGVQRSVVLAPNTTWASKLLPDALWAQALAKLHQHPDITQRGLTVVILGGTFGHAGKLLAQAALGLQPRVLIAPAWDLAQTAYFFSRCALFVAPDTGLVHLADLLGVPCVALFGPTRHVMHGPFLHQYNRNAAIQVPCPHFYQKEHIPCYTSAQGRDCMAQLSVDYLVAHITRILREVYEANLTYRSVDRGNLGSHLSSV